MIGNIFSSINMKLLPMKFHYFLFNLGVGPVLGNLAIIARQNGISSTVVGFLLTALCLVATISKPAFGWLADRFKLHKFIFIVMQAITALTFFSVYFIPPFSNKVTINSKATSTDIYFCPKDPIWDKCLNERINRHNTKLFKCQLKCESEAYANHIENNYDRNLETFEYEILIDMRTIEKNSSCIILKEYNNTSIPNNSASIFNNYLNLQIYNRNCEVICDNDFLRGTLAKRDVIPDNEIYKKYQFWLFCGLLLIGYSALFVVISMADTICFDLLGDDSHLYGRQRMWDSIGAGIAAVFVGTIIDTVSGGLVFKNYTVIYFLCLVTISTNLICSMKLNYSQPVKSKSIVKDVGKLFKSVKIITFFCWCSFSGFFSAAIYNFIFWHLEELMDEIGQNECGDNHVKTLEGIDMLIQCLVGEIPFFFWSGYIFKKIGHVNCMHLIFGAFAIRFFYYSLLSNPWWVLPIEVLNGLNYGLLCSVMTTYTNFIASPGTEATLQGFVGALFEGVGISLGNLVAGTLFKIVGGSYTYMIFGIVAICAMAVHILIHTLLNIYEKNNKINSNEITVGLTEAVNS